MHRRPVNGLQGTQQDRIADFVPDLLPVLQHRHHVAAGRRLAIHEELEEGRRLPVDDDAEPFGHFVHHLIAGNFHRPRLRIYLDHEPTATRLARQLGNLQPGFVLHGDVDQLRRVGDHVAEHIADIVGAAGQRLDALPVARLAF